MKKSRTEDNFNTSHNINQSLERMGELLAPFSALFDGEIKYKPIIHNNIAYHIAESFFGDTTEIITEEDIVVFLTKLRSTQQELMKIQRDVLKGNENKPIFSQLFEESFIELDDKFDLLEHAVYIEASK